MALQVVSSLPEKTEGRYFGCPLSKVSAQLMPGCARAMLSRAARQQYYCVFTFQIDDRVRGFMHRGLTDKAGLVYLSKARV